MNYRELCQIILNYSAGLSPHWLLICEFVEVFIGFVVLTSPPSALHLLHHLLCFDSTVEAKKRIRKELCEKDSDCLFMRMLAVRWHAFFPPSPSHEAVKWNRYSKHYVIKCNPDPAFWCGTSFFSTWFISLRFLALGQKHWSRVQLQRVNWDSVCPAGRDNVWLAWRQVKRHLYPSAYVFYSNHCKLIIVEIQFKNHMMISWV